MKNVASLFLFVLALTSSQALPSDKPVRKPVKKQNPKAPAAKPAIVAPIPTFHWFGPVEKPVADGKKDKC